MFNSHVRLIEICNTLVAADQHFGKLKKLSFISFFILHWFSLCSGKSVSSFLVVNRRFQVVKETVVNHLTSGTYEKEAAAED